jgi:polyketide biosynthesis enoyl-CoA hydratase PksI
MSGVVHLSYPSPRVAVIELADREHTNQFTPALLEGLSKTLTAAVANPRTHVVVVHGYDAIFSAGGTQEQLMGIFEGRLSFDKPPFYRAFLDCELPVIAAMQGHAMGGGLLLGLFADLVIMAEESLYGASFMKYGFTPGMGSTLIMPEKLGMTLAAEMLLTARGYHGGELLKRGVNFPVLKRKDVIPAALKMADEIAEKPLVSLKLLKRQLTARISAQLPETTQAELAMHRTTFAQPEVRQRIQELYGE